jgi:hypothetical protein
MSLEAAGTILVWARAQPVVAERHRLQPVNTHAPTRIPVGAVNSWKPAHRHASASPAVTSSFAAVRSTNITPTVSRGGPQGPRWPDLIVG